MLINVHKISLRLAPTLPRRVMRLSSNHAFYTSSLAVNEIIKPLKQLGITYFSYMRSDPDGGRIYLYSNTEILDSYLKNKYYLRGNKESAPRNYKDQILLWSTLPNQYEYDENVRSRGIDHGMFIFEPKGDSLEAFAFATQKENVGIINTYLTKLDFLKTFTHYFRDKAAALINSAEKSKIILPFHNDKLNFIEKDVNVDFKLLSNRQIECCSLLVNGKTSKEIANLLGLSIRTVEYYISNVKVKLHCKNKAELIAKLIQLLKS